MPTTICALCNTNNDDGDDNYDANIDDDIRTVVMILMTVTHRSTMIMQVMVLIKVTMMTMTVDDSENNDLIKYFDDICPNNGDPAELLH